MTTPLPSRLRRGNIEPTATVFLRGELRVVPVPSGYAALEAQAVNDAAEYLGTFADGWPRLANAYRDTALKAAINHLVVITVVDAVRAEVWIADVAAAAGLPKRELRKQITDRVRLFRNLNFPKLYAGPARREIEDQLCRILF